MRNALKLIVLFNSGGIPELNLAAPATSPAVGSELLVDGALESWVNATTTTNYTQTIAGTSTVNREASVIHGGTFAARLDVDSANSNAQISQGVNTAHNWYQVSAWAKASSGTPTFKLGTNGNAAFTLSTTYAQYIGSGLATNVIASFLRLSAISLSIYLDDLSSKLLTFSSIIAFLGTHATRDGSYNCTPTVALGSQAGIIVAYLNSSNFVIAVVDRAPATPVATLYKCVAGVYTSVISAAITYSAAAILKVTASGNSFSLFYAGAQVGTTQTIADAGLTGLDVYAFSTLAANSVGTVTTTTP